MIFVTGENVVDLIPAGEGLLRPALGGGPANTAVAASRLDAPVAFAGRFGADAYGRAFRRRLADAGVDLLAAVDLPLSSTLALVTIGPDGAASYDFWLTGAADFAAAPLPPATERDIVHVGSIAAYWPPGADVAEAWLRGSAATITYDVNLRPIVLATQPDAIDRIDRLARRAHVVKASDDDLRLAYPDSDPETTARGWLDHDGPRLVVLTLGAAGAVALTRDGGRVHVAAPRIDVADTIGAGDAAMGALLARLHAIGLDGVLADLDTTLRFVVGIAALACTRPGAYAPNLDDAHAAGFALP